MRVKILHLTSVSDTIAGAERLLVDLARAADRAQWDLVFVTVEPEGELNRTLSSLGWRTYSLHSRRPLALPLAWWRLRSIVRRERPHIIHSHLFHASVLASFPGIPAGTVRIQTRHYTDYLGRYGNFSRRKLDAWAARRFDGLFAVSEEARKWLVEVDKVSPNRVAVVENAVDFYRLAELDEEHGRTVLSKLGVKVKGAVIIGVAASLVHAKGHETLLRAFAGLLKHRKDAVLIIMGDGPERARLERLRTELELDGSVHFLAHRPDAPVLIRALDCYVQPSLSEGFGLAAAEAMAMGIPVVVSHVGGLSRLVRDRVDGLVVEPGRDDALLRAMEEILEDPRLRRRLSDSARDRIREHYSLPRLLRDYDYWYRERLDAHLAGRVRGT